MKRSTQHCQHPTRPLPWALVIIAAAVGAAAVISATFWINSGKPGVPLPAPGNMVAPARAGATLASAASAVAVAQPMAGDVCLPPVGEAPAAPRDEQVRESIRAVLAKKMDVSALVDLSQRSDAGAALALFQRIRPCSDTTRYLDSMEFSLDDAGFMSAAACRRIPARLRANPINILIPAADAGSTAAKLLILKNAPTVAAVKQAVGNASANDIAELQATAERYGKDAASAGSASAAAWLAQAYLSGAFGSKREQAAYAITYEMNQSLQGEESRSRLNYVTGRMSASDLARVRPMLDRCRARKEARAASVLISPFR
ncbi:hypothetical protein F2P44_13325 [Massilia sp. CCM 8695]|uniref:SPOR domain-containing protein n=1 Tax=Massilia frigida TaxID=2609281 RepID=A0ABX0NAH8_9BURK|nr:hypothetical protein [Massilia frigida]NHZ80246.1 hypothetical protein [Massilia frigida]